MSDGTTAKLRRLEPAAIAGDHEPRGRQLPDLLEGERPSPASSSRSIYLLAFGLGLGATLVDEVDGVAYIQFVGTGMVATAVIFSSALPAMFGTFVKHRFQNTYDAILAAPVDVEELVTAEMLWIALRSGFYGCVPLLVTIGFGLDPAWGMLLVPFFCFATALGFAGFGIAMAATVAKIDQFNYVTTLVHHPALPRRRHLLPDRPACPRASRSSPSSTPCTSWSNWSAAAPSASRRSTSPASPS